MKYIYLHGFLSGPASRKGLFLEEQFKALGIPLERPDLNQPDFSEMTISGQLKIIESCIAEAGQPVVLLGSSLGGYLATLAAERHKQVRRLVLMAPAFRFAERYLKSLNEAQLREWREKGHLDIYHGGYQENRQLKYGIVEDARQYIDFPLKRQLPVQIFHGLRDEVVPYSLSLDYLKEHPMTDLVLLHSDHGLLDKLDVMWDYISAFLNLR
ncbi:MAG: alpha/beta fold hydrolase [Calditrichia bacterium]